MWWNASRGHNVLQFGEYEQRAGADFHAELIELDEREASVWLVLELARAYPSEAGVESWQRSFLLRRGECPVVTLTDRFLLRRPMTVKFPLFTPCPFDVGEDKAVFKISPDLGLAMTWDPGKLRVASEPLESDEPFLEDAWGGKLNKLLCRIPGEVAEAECQSSFVPCGAGQPKRKSPGNCSAT